VEFETVSARVKREFDLEPSAETLAIARRLRAVGATPSAVPSPTAAPRAEPAPSAPRPSPVRSHRGRVLALVVAGRAGAVAAPRLLSRGVESPSDNVLAVAPFTLVGADPSLAYLGEGMVDLMAARLSGADGPRAVDARSVLAAWHSASAGTSTPAEPDAV